MLTLDNCPPVMTVSEVAAIARLDTDTVYLAIRRGELSAVRAGRAIRVTREALKRWLMGELAEAAS